MKTVVCDASPLIFLAKLNRLELIPRVLDAEVCVLRCVADEVLGAGAGPVERQRLLAFLESVGVVEFEPPAEPAGALSRCDRATLAWAIENRIDWLLADERLLRRIAEEKGIAVIGFLGLLLRAARRNLLSAGDARAAIDESVSRHGCRISIALYQRLLSELAIIANR